MPELLRASTACSPADLDDSPPSSLLALFVLFEGLQQAARRRTARKHSSTAQQHHSSMLDSLEPLLLRHIALASPDPSGLVLAFRAAWQAIICDESFALDWFLKWQPLLAPNR